MSGRKAGWIFFKFFHSFKSALAQGYWAYFRLTAVSFTCSESNYCWVNDTIPLSDFPILKPKPLLVFFLDWSYLRVFAFFPPAALPCILGFLLAFFSCVLPVVLRWQSKITRRTCLGVDRLAHSLASRRPYHSRFGSRHALDVTATIHSLTSESRFGGYSLTLACTSLFGNKVTMGTVVLYPNCLYISEQSCMLQLACFWQRP